MRSRRLRPLLLAGWAVASGLLSKPSAAVPTDEDCLACHSDTTLAMERRGRTVSLHVDAEVVRRSAHAGLACTDCHAGLDPGSLPHSPRIAPVQCMSCHAEPAPTHGFHPQVAQATGTDGPPAASCKTCHGTHGVTSPRLAGSKFHPSRLADSCGDCHAEVGRAYRESAHGRALAAEQPGAPTCLACHGPERLAAPPGEPPTAALKIRQEKLCLSCHLDDPEVRSRVGPRAGFIAAYEWSAHGRALLAGNAAAPNCVDCHGSHRMREGLDPASQVTKPNVPGTCGPCHAQEAAGYAESVHAAAVRRGGLDAPVCTDCHGEHDIRGPHDPRSPVAPANVARQVCVPCHASVRLAEKYSLPVGPVRAFADSFHGLALRAGDVEVANCASCHGSHAILPPSDPRSSVHPDNLAATCGQCHPGADRRFAAGKVHVAATRAEQPLLYWIARIYVALIVIVIGAMLVHNLADYAHRIARRLRGPEPERDTREGGQAWVLRMTVNERCQHLALLLTFVVLALTGFMLRYPEAWWCRWIWPLHPALFELRGTVHRAAGILMLAAGIWHLGYVVATERGRSFWRDMRPSPGDLADAVRAMAFAVGLSRRRPRFGRFSYVEKSEYWAVLWGTAVMGTTGVVMWFEETFIEQLTKLGWDAARAIHFYEAVLATLAIAVWHLYHVVFKPGVYPMNPAWLTGKIPVSLMLEEHPLELDQMLAGASREEPSAEKGEPGTAVAAPAAAGGSSQRDGAGGDPEDQPSRPERDGGEAGTDLP